MDLVDYIVEVVIENKPQARDPTGETIQRDLIAKKGYANISNVRSGQYLRIHLKAENKVKAEKIVTDMCNDLRIFNPVTQNLSIFKVTEQS